MVYRNKDCESVLCKNFSEKFYDLVKINGYLSNYNCNSNFIDYLYEFSNFPSTIDYVVRDDKHHEIFCTFDMCGFRYFRIEITFQKDSYVNFVVYRSYDEPAVDVTMKFNVKGFESLFNFSVSQVFHTDEENASEPEHEEQHIPEQPVEDAEEQDNPELTPLERAIFEAFENSSNLYVEYICKSLDVMEDEEIDEYGCYSSVVLEQVAYFHKLASIEDLKTQFLLEIISKAGLDETYQAWLAERKEQEAVGVSK